jgi:hypothetical protein
MGTYGSIAKASVGTLRALWCAVAAAAAIIVPLAGAPVAQASCAAPANEIEAENC